jgi:tungstate transport system substrate-binding protein
MLIRLIAVTAALLTTLVSASAQERHVTIAATTSIQDAGLFNFLLPRFYASTGITVQVRSRASRLGLVAAERGEVDLALVNDPEATDRFVQAVPGTLRYKFMHNDFVIVGPIADPAGIKNASDAAAALHEIARTRSTFISRADDSGLHHREQRLWRTAHVNPNARSGNWYHEVGLGMAASLHLAAQENGYVLVDRGTWLAEGDTSRLTIITQGDPLLFNQYEAVLVKRQPGAMGRQEEAIAFLDWLLSPEGQDTINSVHLNGQQLFFPSAPRQPIARAIERQ